MLHNLRLKTMRFDQKNVRNLFGAQYILKFDHKQNNEKKS